MARAPLDLPTGCGAVDEVPYGVLPYPTFSVETVDGTITVLENSTESVPSDSDESGSDGDEVESVVVGTQRYSELVSGDWTVAERRTASFGEARVYTLPGPGDATHLLVSSEPG